MNSGEDVLGAMDLSRLFTFYFSTFRISSGGARLLGTLSVLFRLSSSRI